MKSKPKKCCTKVFALGQDIKLGLCLFFAQMKNRNRKKVTNRKVVSTGRDTITLHIEESITGERANSTDVDRAALSSDITCLNSPQDDHF